MLSGLSHSPIRAGIIGAGFMATVHARAIRSVGGQVVAAVGSSPDRAHAAADATGAEFGLHDAESLIGRDDIDVVHVCTPNATHERFALEALASGKSVIVEKPLATSGNSAAAIVNAADSSGQLGTVPFVYRFHPLVREIRARISRGDLGVASVVHGSYLQDWLASDTRNNWRVDVRNGGASRTFADIGSHWCDLFEFVTGDRIASLSARMRTVFPHRPGTEVVQTEDAASISFVTEAGLIGTLVVSQVAAGRKNRLQLEISGSDGSFAFDQEDPERLWIGGMNENTILMRDPARLLPDAARLAIMPGGHSQGYQDCFNAFVADSYSLFAGRPREGTPDLGAGLRAAQLCDAVIASAAAAGWVEPSAASS